MPPRELGREVVAERFEGCLLALALADAFGAPHEGGVFERVVWRLIGKTTSGERRWTDDTQMSLDIAESLIVYCDICQDDLAARFAENYRWSRGYGPGTARVLRDIRRGKHWSEAVRSVHSEGSYGNGAAMRAPVIGLFFWDRLSLIPQMTERMASVTHAHPEGIEGAVLIAVATASATQFGHEAKILEASSRYVMLSAFFTPMSIACDWARSNYAATPIEVRRQLGNGIAARNSCITAIYIADRFLSSSFDEMLRFIISCQGDVDTIGAMAGAIWGAARGAASLPEKCLHQLEQRCRISNIAAALLEKSRSCVI
jgi:poly(ADP-ribose) glycohydrolase ARH3